MCINRTKTLFFRSCWRCPRYSKKAAAQYQYRMIGTCFTFFPTFCRWSANTISGVRSKYPISLFQLIPHLQCCRPMNCCFILWPQEGQILLLFPIYSNSCFNDHILQQLVFAVQLFLEQYKDAAEPVRSTTSLYCSRYVRVISVSTASCRAILDI